jgi:hypothetical protein
MNIVPRYRVGTSHDYDYYLCIYTELLILVLII